jgi:hypothetical protein
MSDDYEKKGNFGMAKHLLAQACHLTIQNRHMLDQKTKLQRE